MYTHRDPFTKCERYTINGQCSAQIIIFMLIRNKMSEAMKSTDVASIVRETRIGFDYDD